MTFLGGFLLGCASAFAGIYLVRRAREAKLERMMDAAERAEEEQWRELNRLRDDVRKETLRWN